MTRPTIADLRAVLNGEADDIGAADDVVARASTRPAKPRQRGWLAVTAAVVITLLIGGIIAIVRDTSPAPKHSPSSPHIVWRTFAARGFRFAVKYPSTWHTARFAEHSSFRDAVVYLSDQPMTSPCTTSSSHTGTTISCRGLAIDRLQRGGVAVNWFAAGGPPGHDLFGLAPGRLTKVGGARAKVYIGAAKPASDCGQIGGRTMVTATVQRPHLGNNVYMMQACIDADRHSEQTHLVLASLGTMRQH